MLGVSPLQILNYMNFGRSIQKGRRTIHGEELLAYAGASAERYAAQGLERRVMYRILSDVFTLRPDSGWPKTS
jgi:hypothetical protein